MPRPPARRAAEVSACVKRSKTCGRNSRAIPMPLSLTWSCTRSAFLSEKHRDGAPLGRELDRVREQVRHELLQAPAVAHHHDRGVVRSEAQVDLLRRGARASGVQRRQHDLDEVHRAPLDRQLAAHDARSVEEIVDEARLVVDVALDGFRRALDQRLLEWTGRREQMAPAAQRVERRAQLVRHDGEELVLGAVRALGLGAQPLLGHHQLFQVALRLLALGDVRRDPDQADDAALLVAQRRLAREVSAIGHGFLERHGLARLEHQALVLVQSDRVARLVAHRIPHLIPFGATHGLEPRGVRHQHAALAVLGEDQVRGAGGDRVQQSVALAQRRARALERRGAAHDALVELAVGLAHRALGLALRRRLPEHEHRAGEAVGRIDDRRRVDMHRVHLTVARAQSRFSGSHDRGPDAQGAVQRNLQRSVVALVEEPDQLLDRTPRGLGRAPAGEPLRGGVQEAHPPFAVGGDDAVADRRERHLQPFARLAGLLLGLRALALMVLERARDPQHQRPEPGDHHRGEERHADRLAEEALPLGEKPRPADGERHDERRRQKPARHHRADRAPGERLEQPRRGPRRRKPDRGEHRRDRARRREPEQGRGDVEAQDAKRQAEQREKRHPADQRSDRAVQRHAESPRAGRQWHHHGEQDEREGGRGRDLHMPVKHKVMLDERGETEHRGKRRGGPRRAAAAALHR